MKKTVLITGATSGIGEATARRFAEAGYVCVLISRNLEKLKKMAGELPDAQCIVADFGVKNDFKVLLNKVLTDSKLNIECLVNNAGIFQRHDFSSEDAAKNLKVWENMFQINVFSVVGLTEALIPYFKNKKRGSIVNVSSTLGIRGGAKTTAYSASKAAINNLTVSLALELGEYGIRVNAVCPGIVDTPIHDFNSLPTDEKNKVLKSLGPLQPLGRIGTSTEVAESIYFLASESSAWTTGALLNVDGGISIK